MKYFTTVFFAILFGFNSINAQKDTIPKLKLYKTWIYMQEGDPYKIIGVLYEFKDSTIVLSNSTNIENYQSNNFRTQEISIQNIKEIEFRKVNSVGKGAWIGALSGLVVGVVFGASIEPNSGYLTSTTENNILVYGISFTLLGSAIGALIGSTTIQIPINGSMEKYKKKYDKLNKYPIVK
jgi:hypothetical protein